MDPWFLFHADWLELARIHPWIRLKETTAMKLKKFVSKMQPQQLQVLKESSKLHTLEELGCHPDFKTHKIIPIRMFLPASFNTLADFERCVGLFDLINFMSEENCKEIRLNVKNFVAKKLNDTDGTRRLHLFVNFNDSFKVISFHVEFKNQFEMKGLSSMTSILTAVLDENFAVANSLLTAQAEALVKQEIKTITPFHRFLIAAFPRIVTFMEDDAKGRLSRDIVSGLLVQEYNSEQIGQVLTKLLYDLKDVVRFRDPDMTKAFLQHCNITRFSRSGLQEVVATFDWKHIKVLINHQPRTEHSLLFYFIDLLVNEIIVYDGSENGRNFLKHAFTWEVLKEDSLAHFEQVLQGACPKSVKLFLKYGFHSIAKAECGRCILGGLFGNKDFPKFATLLENEKIDVEERYCEGNTALHIAADRKLFENILWLLEKGADPNVVNSRKDTPLSLLLSNPHHLHEYCVRLLLHGGADITIVSNHSNAGIFGPKVSYWVFDNESVMRLVVQQLAIKEAFGLSIESAVKTFALMFAVPRTQVYVEECRQEVNEMKTLIICETKKYQQKALSILTFLAVRPEQIAHLVKEEDLKVINEFLEIKGSSWRWFYRENVEERVKKIIKIKQLRERATIFTCQFIDIQDPNHLVVIKIVRYLSMKDLLVFE